MLIYFMKFNSIEMKKIEDFRKISLIKSYRIMKLFNNNARYKTIFKHYIKGLKDNKK